MTRQAVRGSMLNLTIKLARTAMDRKRSVHGRRSSEEIEARSWGTSSA